MSEQLLYYMIVNEMLTVNVSSPGQMNLDLSTKYDFCLYKTAEEV